MENPYGGAKPQAVYEYLKKLTDLNTTGHAFNLLPRVPDSLHPSEMKIFNNPKWIEGYELLKYLEKLNTPGDVHTNLDNSLSALVLRGWILKLKRPNSFAKGRMTGTAHLYCWLAEQTDAGKEYAKTRKRPKKETEDPKFVVTQPAAKYKNSLESENSLKKISHQNMVQLLTKWNSDINTIDSDIETAISILKTAQKIAKNHKEFLDALGIQPNGTK